MRVCPDSKASTIRTSTTQEDQPQRATRAEKFGTGFSIVRSDIGGNINRLAAAQAKDPVRYSVVFPIIADEVQRGEQEGRQSDTNALLWLKRCALVWRDGQSCSC